MGNKRKLIYLVGWIVAIAASLSSTKAQAQRTYSVLNYGSQDRDVNQQQHSDQAARAYYQPQYSAEGARHQQAAYRDSFNTPQYRRVAQAPQGRAPQRSFGPRNRFNKIGFGIRQDDPFGENQAQSDPFGETPPARNGFDPFADPPATNQEDPFGEEQMTPETPGGQLTDPFADPPGLIPPRQDIPTREPQTREPEPRQPQTRSRGADPVLPGDADPNLDDPNGSSVLEGNGEEYPPGTVKPDDDNLTNPFKDPANQRNYDENRYIPPAGVYRPPGSRDRQQQYADQNRQPGYQQPGYPQSGYQQQPGYPQQPGYQPQYQQPGYQPAYQPIPGQAPAYQPNYSAPPAQQLVTAPPPAMPVPPANPAYIPTVAPINPCDTCQDCQSGCNNGCGGACLGCDMNRCPNFYFSFFGGWSSLGELTSRSGLGEFRTDDGSVFGVALGRRNGRNLRTELEFSTRSHDVTGFFDGSDLTPLNGDITSYAGMANLYWEFIDVPTRLFKPYVGIGAGFISIDSDIRDANALSILEPGSENDTSLALQYMFGVNYKAYRNVDLFAEYRYLRADTFRLDTTVGTSDRYPYQADNVLFGLRWKF